MRVAWNAHSYRTIWRSVGTPQGFSSGGLLWAMGGGEDGLQEPSESEVLAEHSGALCSALAALLAVDTRVHENVEGWTYAALVAACVSHLPSIRAQLWKGGVARRTVELAREAADEAPGTFLQLRSGWLYTAARCVVEAEERDARQPPRWIMQRIETSSVPSKEECLKLWERAEQVHLRHDGGESVVHVTTDDGLSDVDRKLQQQQIIRDAENIDFDSLRDASSLPTLLKLFGVAKLRDQAARTICRTALRTTAPDTRTAMQKKMQQAAAKAIMANGLWERPKTMSEILDEASKVVRDGEDGSAERMANLEKMLKAGNAQMGLGGEDGDNATFTVAPVSKPELTALLQQHITWGFVGGRDRFCVHVRKVIETTAQGGLQVLPAVEKRGPEHAVGEHHVSIAIWGKPGDVGEPPREPAQENSKGTKQQQTGREHRVFSRFNSGKQLVDDVSSRHPQFDIHFSDSC